MARTSRAAPWCLLLAAACALALSAGGLPFPQGAAGVAHGGTQAKFLDVVVAVVAFIVKFLFSISATILPGITVAFIGFTVYTRRQQMTPKLWLGVVLLAMGAGALIALQLKNASASVPDEVPPGLISVDTIRSGEAIVTDDGRFVRLPDPTKAEGEPVDPGWQRSLAGAMTEAIRHGQEQVVLVFSRQGCPWCERQKPVLERAIVKRAQDIAGNHGGGEPAPAAAFIGGGAGSSLLMAPLRVFVLDANEFPYLAQQFRIEAFPTSMVFGPPGATPLVAQGYLDDDTLDKILKTAAVSGPPAEGRQRRKRRGIFR